MGGAEVHQGTLCAGRLKGMLMEALQGHMDQII